MLLERRSASALWDLISKFPASRDLFVRRTRTESPIMSSRAVKGAAPRKSCATHARIDEFFYESLDAGQHDILDHDAEHYRNEEADNNRRAEDDQKREAKSGTGQKPYAQSAPEGYDYKKVCQVKRE
jgi:hypothetical protein